VTFYRYVVCMVIVFVSHAHARDYDPGVGRYIESDPIGLAGESISTYSYAFSNPNAYIDPDGLKVVFYGSGSNVNAVRSAYELVRSTQRGKFLCEKLEQSPTVYTIRADGPRAYYDPNTNTVNVDPNYRPTIQTTAGPQSSSTDSLLAHELGHAATKIKDDGPDNMNNIKENENPVRRELRYPPRTKY